MSQLIKITTLHDGNHVYKASYQNLVDLGLKEVRLEKTSNHFFGVSNFLIISKKDIESEPFREFGYNHPKIYFDNDNDYAYSIEIVYLENKWQIRDYKWEGDPTDDGMEDFYDLEDFIKDPEFKDYIINF